jgi:peroxiredoxin
MRALLLTSLMTIGICSISAPAFAGEYNAKLNIGDKAPVIGELPAADGKKYSLASFEKAEAMVVVFTCNSCPYAIDYEDRLIEFHKQHCSEGKVALVAINCNLVPEDSLENMTARAEEKGFCFPYLFDATQKSGREFGALRTPECFVLNQQRELVYMGAFDDNAKADAVTKKYVVSAVQAALAGKSAETKETPPVGCLIRYKRTRE